MKKIEHLGIAVYDIEQGEALYEKLFNTRPYKREHVEEQGVLTSFLRVGPSKVELLAPTNRESVIQKFLDKKGAGLHHIAFEVADIESEMHRLKNAGFNLLNDRPVRGADNKIVCFIHPRSAGGVLVELVQELNS